MQTMNANNNVPFIKKLGIKKKKEHPFCLLNERNQRRQRVRAMDTVNHSIMAFLQTHCGHVILFVGGSSDLFIVEYVYNVLVTPFCLHAGNVVTWCRSPF
jgi:hypothetical protein